MRTFRALLLLPLLATAACGSAKQDPQPTPPASTAPEATYDIGATSAVLPPPTGVFSTAPPLPGSLVDRRAVTVHMVLPSGNELSLTYTYVGQQLPLQAGPFTLDAPVTVQLYTLTTTNSYQAPSTAAGTLSLDKVTPATVSGKYTGPLVSGGPVVRITFQRVTL